LVLLRLCVYLCIYDLCVVEDMRQTGLNVFDSLLLKEPDLRRGKQCDKCGKFKTIRHYLNAYQDPKYKRRQKIGWSKITILCGCGMHIVYRNGVIKFISKDDYDPEKAKSNKPQQDNIFVRIYRAGEDRGKGRVKQSYDEARKLIDQKRKKKKA